MTDAIIPPASPDDEQTPPSTPLAKLLDDALGRFATDRLPEILAASEKRISANTAAAVTNALGERLYALETDVRRHNDSEHESGQWRIEAERRLSELEKWRRDTERCDPPRGADDVQ